MSISRVKFLLLLFPALAWGQGAQFPKYTVATLPAASSYPSYVVQVIDGANAADCSVGGGTINVFCKSQGGSWLPQSPFQSLTTNGVGAATLISGVLNVPSASSMSPFSNAPLPGQSAIIYPTSSTVSLCGGGAYGTGASTNTSGYVYQSLGGAGDCISSVTWNFSAPGGSVTTSSGATIPVANITAVYPFIFNSLNVVTTGGNTSGDLNCTGTGLTFPGYLGYIHPSFSHKEFIATTSLSPVTTANINAMSCTADVGQVDGLVTPPNNANNAVTLIGAYVYYTGTPVTAPNNVNVIYPLVYTGYNQQLSLQLPFNYAADVGTANTYVVTNSAFSVYTSGLMLTFCPANPNTGASTLNLNGQGAWPILNWATGLAIGANALQPCSPTVPPATLILGNTDSGNYTWFLESSSSGSLSGMTAGQVPIAATPTTVTSSKALAGTGAGITTGPTTTTLNDCVKFGDTAGTLADAGAACGSGSGGITLQNAGSPLGTITTLNCSTGTTCTAASGTGTITASGSGGTSPFAANAILPVSVCQSTTAASGLSLPATNAPTPYCYTGTNVNLGTLHFPSASNTSAQIHFPLPSDTDCSSPFNLVLTWRAASTTGSVIWSAQTQFTAAGSPLDGSWNTATTAVGAPGSTTEYTVVTTISNITATGCTAGDQAYLLLQRNGASDTMSGDAELISANLTYTRDTGVAGGTFNVNGLAVGSPNLNGTTPAAPSGNVNVTWQVSGNDVSGYVPNTSTSSPFSSITTGTNTAAAMVVSTGASLGTSGTGTIAATSVGGVTPGNTPTSGQVCTATASNACTWTTPTSYAVPAWLPLAEVPDSTAESVSSGAVTIPNDFLLIMSCRFGTGTTGVASSSPVLTFTPETAQINSTTGIQLSYAYVTSGGSYTLTCTQSSSAAGVSMVAGGFTNTLGTVNTSVGSSSSLTAGSYTTTQRTADVVCASVGALTSWTPGYVAGGYATVMGVSDTAINTTNADQGCEYKITPYAVSASAAIGSGSSNSPVSTYLGVNY